MAKQKRQPAKAKPITENPLFPAVVGLWFGALFGLGSLAVRPTLIENLVLQSRIDLVIPAAAPPLGITARILLALLLAALGALLGAVLARRLTRPKVEHKERKRGARDMSVVSPRYNPRDAHPDAPARRPISVHDELGEGESAPMLTGRRRALAIEPEEQEFVPHDSAPLPGGAPQVLDIASLAPAAGADEAVPAHGTFSPPPVVQAASVPLDWQSAAPVAQSLGQTPTALPDAMRQDFQAGEAPPAPAPCPVSAAAHADGRQVFGMEPQVPTEAPRQIFGLAVEGDHVPQDFVRSAGFKTSVFETETPEPLFDRGPAPVQSEAVEAFAPLPAAQPAEPAPIPQAFEPMAEPAPAVPAEAPVAAEPLPSPASLGMTDLASRLAESMRRRRAARGTGDAVAAAPQIEPAPADPVMPQVSVAAELPVAAEPAPEFAPLAEAPAPSAPESPAFAAPQPIAFEAPPAFVPPAELAESEPVATAPVPEPASELPSAMRPLALDAFLEEDAAIDPSILPPRHIAMPPPPMPMAEAPAPAEPALELAEEDAVEDLPGETAFGSLLDLAPVRSGFVRIEEAEVAQAEPEPVVIFPGQAPLAQPGQAAAALASAEATPFRRFDSPSAVGHGQPVSLEAAAAAMPPAEADQALRSALANLQRMSGAA